MCEGLEWKAIVDAPMFAGRCVIFELFFLAFMTYCGVSLHDTVGIKGPNHLPQGLSVHKLMKG